MAIAQLRKIAVSELAELQELIDERNGTKPPEGKKRKK